MALASFSLQLYMHAQGLIWLPMLRFVACLALVAAHLQIYMHIFSTFSICVSSAYSWAEPSSTSNEDLR